MKNYYHLNNIYRPDPLRLGDIYLIQIGRMFCLENTSYESHLHLNWFELTVVTDGEGSVTTNNVNIPVKSGDIYLSFPADVHQIHSSAEHPLKYDFFSFYTTNPAFNEQLEKILTQFQDPHERTFSDSRIQTLIVNSIAEFHHSDDALILSKELLENTFHSVIIYLIRDFNEKSLKKNQYNVNRADILCYQIMNYIDTHIFTLKNLNSLETITNYNYSYLSNLFKKTTNITLQEYYLNSKLNAAKQLIKERKLKIGEIAELLNYSSIYVFSHAYKNKYGVSPQEERRMDIKPQSDL